MDYVPLSVDKNQQLPGWISFEIKFGLLEFVGLPRDDNIGEIKI